MGRFIIIFLYLLKSFLLFTSPLKIFPFFYNFSYAEVINARPGMNLLMYETLPKKLFNSLTTDDNFMVTTAVAFSGSTSIPLQWTRNPRNSQRVL